MPFLVAYKPRIISPDKNKYNSVIYNCELLHDLLNNHTKSEPD